MMQTVLFYACAALLLVGSTLVVLAKSPLRSALSLIGALCAMSLLFVLLDATFVAAMQVLVYAGAIMVLFVFVIMLLNLDTVPFARSTTLSLSTLLGVGAAGYFTYRIATAAPGGSGLVVDGSVRAVGALLLTDYLFAFEAVSILLLTAVVGAIVFGLKRLT